jgi:Lrp/AsnC family transcriptional regulator, regulator for asnA, asnC and gidA
MVRDGTNARGAGQPPPLPAPATPPLATSTHSRPARPYPVAMAIDGRVRSKTSGSRSGEEVSDLDKRIIEHLQADGRRPFTQIAADLGVSEAAVRARTNRLIDRGILQVVGVTDPLKLGFQQMAMIGIRCESDRLVSVAEQVADMPEVDYVVITAGTYDLLIETVCEDNEALLRFLTEKLRAIDGVRETETFVYLRMVKQTYQWGTR